jgi:hypothetical protein
MGPQSTPQEELVLRFSPQKWHNSRIAIEFLPDLADNIRECL